MNELMLDLQPYLVNMAIAILTAIGGWIGLKAKEWLDTKAKERIVFRTMMFAQQTAYDLIGAERLEIVKRDAIAWAKEKGLSFSEIELKIMIESFMAEVKDAYAGEQD